MPAWPEFIAHSYEAQGPLADQEDTINFYVENAEVQSETSRAIFYPTPGVVEITAASAGNGRAHFFLDGREFAVVGDQALEVGQYGAITVLGTMATDANPATISSNGDAGGQILFTSGGNAYIFDTGSSVFTQIAVLNGKATQGDHLDGFFIALDANTSTMFVSDLLDGLTWDPTQFAQRSIAPDPWISMKVSTRYIWLLGTQTSEAWFDAGTSFPFAPHPSGLIQYGCAAPFSPFVAQSSLYWLASSINGQGQVVRAAGFAPEVISTFALNVAMNGYSTISDAVGDAYSDLGHTFYLLRLGIANVTWCYDLNSNGWTKRATWISESNAYDAWRPQFHAFAFGEHRMLDAASSKVYRMSSDLKTDVDVREIRRLRRAPALVNELERIYIASFELDLEVGLGNQASGAPAPVSPLAVAIKATIHDSADASSYAFASITPANNLLYIVFTQTATSSAPAPTATSVTGAGLTFAEIGTAGGLLYSGSGVRRIQAWRALVTSGAVAGVITVTLDGSSTAMDAIILEFTGIDTSGTNGSAAVVQSATNIVLSGNGNTVTLAAFGDSGNRPVSFISHRENEVSTPGAGYTELDDAGHAAPVTGTQTQWNETVPGTTPGVTWATTADSGGVALEIKLADPAAPAEPLGVRPQVMMRISRDGGKTWGPERTVSAGAQGDYLKRVRFNRLGQGRRMVVEIVVTDPNIWRITNAYLTLGSRGEAA